MFREPDEWQLNQQASFRSNSRQLLDIYQRRVFRQTISKFDKSSRSRTKVSRSQYESKRSVETQPLRNPSVSKIEEGTGFEFPSSVTQPKNIMSKPFMKRKSKAVAPLQKLMKDAILETDEKPKQTYETQLNQEFPTTERNLVSSARARNSVRRSMTNANPVMLGRGLWHAPHEGIELRDLKKSSTHRVEALESTIKEVSKKMNGIEGEFILDYGQKESSEMSEVDLHPGESSPSKHSDNLQIKMSPRNTPHQRTRKFKEEESYGSRFMTDLGYPETKRRQHKNQLRALKDYKYCIILPNDCWKVKWDLFISLLIVATAIYTPYRLAYIDQETVEWLVLEIVVDTFFLLDIIFTFFSAYYDSTDVLIDRRTKIACDYMRGWFWIDFVSIFPVGLIVQNTTQVNDLARVARLTRLYRLIKMIKLLRMMRIVKQRGKFQKYLSYIFKTSVSVERLLIFMTIFLILCHVASCLWYFIAKMEEFDDNGWVMKHAYQHQSNSELYLIGFYFTITTITTVGYGDMSGGTFIERIFCICLMIVGVVSYSFAISSLSSVISTLDSKQAKLKEKLNILNNIRSEYEMDFELYWKLRQSLYYDHTKDMTDKMKLLKELPGNLKVSVSNLMYRKVVKGIDYFENKSAHFMATIGPLLRPIIIEKNEQIFLKRDPVDAIYFIKKGEAGFNFHKENPPDLIYATVKEGNYFGDVDFMKDEENEDYKRLFSVKAMSDLELLLLQKSDLYQIGLEFKNEISDLFSHSQDKLDNLMELERKGNEWYKDMVEKMREERETEDGDPDDHRTIHYHSSQRPLSMKRYELDIEEEEERIVMKPPLPKRIQVLKDQAQNYSGSSVRGGGPSTILESENQISRAPTKKNLTISTSEDEQHSPTRKNKSAQLQSVFEKDKNSRQTAMEAMMSELKKRNDSKPRTSLPEENSTVIPGGGKLSRASVSSLEAQNSIKHLIHLQISKANEQFSQIQNSLFQMIQLKEMLVKESSNQEEKQGNLSLQPKQPQRKTITTTTPPNNPTPWRLKHQASASISGPIIVESKAQKQKSLSDEGRTPRVKTMKRDESIKVQRDSLLEDQESYEFHSSSEQDIIAQLNKEKKKVTREDIARLLREQKRKKEEKRKK